MGIAYDDEGELRFPSAIGGMISFMIVNTAPGRATGIAAYGAAVQFDLAFEVMGNSSDGELTSRDGFQIAGSIARGIALGELGAVAGAAGVVLLSMSWKLCTNMRTQDVTDTLDLALAASGCDQAHVVHKPRLLSLSH